MTEPLGLRDTGDAPSRVRALVHARLLRLLPAAVVAAVWREAPTAPGIHALASGDELTRVVNAARCVRELAEAYPGLQIGRAHV